MLIDEPLLQVGPESSDFFRLLEKHTGLSLGNEKIYLLSSRLKTLAKQHGFSDVPALLSSLLRSGLTDLHWLCFEAMTTQETCFFRDDFCFDNLRYNVLPELLQKRKGSQRLRIWSAGTSNGQEAYSLSMMLHDDFPQTQNWDIQIVATDLSYAALSKAQSGIYNADELARGLEPHHLERHFRPTPGGSMQVAPELKRQVHFERMNLIEDNYPPESFDLVLLRNVMIYFKLAEKEKILNRVSRQLATDGGYLILGSAETIFSDMNWQKHSARRGYYFQYHA